MSLLGGPVVTMGALVAAAAVAVLVVTHARTRARPMREPACPRCRQRLGAVLERCPECGTDLGDGVVDARWPARRSWIWRGRAIARVALLVSAAAVGVMLLLRAPESLVRTRWTTIGTGTSDGRFEASLRLATVREQPMPGFGGGGAGRGGGGAMVPGAVGVLGPPPEPRERWLEVPSREPATRPADPGGRVIAPPVGDFRPRDPGWRRASDAEAATIAPAAAALADALVQGTPGALAGLPLADPIRSDLDATSSAGPRGEEHVVVLRQAYRAPAEGELAILEILTHDVVGGATGRTVAAGAGAYLALLLGIAGLVLRDERSRRTMVPVPIGAAFGAAASTGGTADVAAPDARSEDDPAPAPAPAPAPDRGRGSGGGAKPDHGVSA